MWNVALPSGSDTEAFAGKMILHDAEPLHYHAVSVSRASQAHTAIRRSEEYSQIALRTRFHKSLGVLILMILRLINRLAAGAPI